MVEKKYKVAVVGLVHDHVWVELPHWKALPNVELVAASDMHPELLQRAQKEFGIDAITDDFRKLFDKIKPDIVQVCTSNAGALLVVKEAAKRGIQIMLEKPMAATMQQAEQMLDALENSKSKMMINWPNWWRPNLLEAANWMKAGKIGQVYHAKMRMAHPGPKEIGCSKHFVDWLTDPALNGNGVYMDYCSYGAVTFIYFFGWPDRATAVAKTTVKKDLEVADNAVLTLEYEKLIAQAEGSWTQVPAKQEATFYGTKGILTLDKERMWFTKENGSKLEVKPTPLPKGKRSGPEYFVHCLENDEAVEGVFSPDVSFEAQSIMEQAVS